MKTLKISVLFLLLGTITVQAQVGINITNPDTTAILHIHSDNRGVLLPTVNESVRNSLATAPAAEGLLVFDPVQRIYYFFNRSTKQWIALNPFQALDIADPDNHADNPGAGDVRLSTPFQDRNVVIGGGTAPAEARLHVHGSIRAEDSVSSPKLISDSLISATGNIDTLEVRRLYVDTITSTVRANKIYADTVRATSVFGQVPIGTIVMWKSWEGNQFDTACWRKVTEMTGRFPIGAGTPPQTYEFRTGVNIGSVRSVSVGRSADNDSVHGQAFRRLSVDQMPPHRHYTRFLYASPGGSTGHSHARMHNAGYEGRAIPSSLTGGENNTTAAAFDNRPPFFGVYFIQKISNKCPS